MPRRGTAGSIGAGLKSANPYLPHLVDPARVMGGRARRGRTPAADGARQRGARSFHFLCRIPTLIWSDVKGGVAEGDSATRARRRPAGRAARAPKPKHRSFSCFACRPPRRWHGRGPRNCAITAAGPALNSPNCDSECVPRRAGEGPARALASRWPGVVPSAPESLSASAVDRRWARLRS